MSRGIEFRPSITMDWFHSRGRLKCAPCGRQIDLGERCIRTIFKVGTQLEIEVMCESHLVNEALRAALDEAEKIGGRVRL